jgi:hypothetical protein
VAILHWVTSKKDPVDTTPRGCASSRSSPRNGSDPQDEKLGGDIERKQTMHADGVFKDSSVTTSITFEGHQSHPLPNGIRYQVAQSQEVEQARPDERAKCGILSRSASEPRQVHTNAIPLQADLQHARSLTTNPGLVEPPKVKPSHSPNSRGNLTTLHLQELAMVKPFAKTYPTADESQRIDDIV